MSKKPNYEALKKIWYDKLEEEYKSGKSDFYDIERHESTYRTYRHSSSNKYGKFSKEWQDSKVEYYGMATRFLNEYEFTTELEHVIWEYHTNGISIRDITKLLNNVRTSPLSKTKIGEKLKNLKDIMKGLYIAK